MVQIAGAPISTALKFPVNKKYIYFLLYSVKIYLLPAVDCRTLINPTSNIIINFSTWANPACNFVEVSLGQ